MPFYRKPNVANAATKVVSLMWRRLRWVRPLNPEFGTHKPKQIAFIVEEDCIGCVKCIAACPVEAIVGAAKCIR
jgi:Na+-translocating ferredoxin:NAD+ oxidoreductase RNF subunit RnfB